VNAFVTETALGPTVVMTTALAVRARNLLTRTGVPTLDEVPDLLGDRLSTGTPVQVALGVFLFAGTLAPLSVAGEASSAVLAHSNFS
jgi:hypothetical protein